MKTIKFLALFALSAIVLSASAQNTLVYQLTSNQASNAIVRDWGNFYVVSMQLPYAVGTPYQFQLVKKHYTGYTLHPAYTITLTSGYSVSDFTIFNDVVYFVGSYNSSNGVMGYFSLNALVSGNVSVDYYTFDDEAQFALPWDNYSELFLFRNFSKITAFSDGTNTHVLILGEKISQKTYSPQQITTEGTGAIYDVIPGSSSFHYVYNPADSEFFDDIVVENDRLLTFGYTRGGGIGDTYSRMFDRNAPFSLSCAISQYRIVQCHVGCISKVHAAKTNWLTGEYSVLAYYGAFSLVSYQGLALPLMKHYVAGGALSMKLPMTIRINQGTTLASSCKISGIAMDTNSSKLYVLQDMTQPLSSITRSAVCKFSTPVLGSATIPTTYDATEKWNDICLYGNNAFITVNKQASGTKTFMENNSTSTTCKPHYSIPAEWISVTEDEFISSAQILTYRTSKSLAHTSTTLQRTVATYSIECNY